MQRSLARSLAAAPPAAGWAATLLQLVEADPYGIWRVDDMLGAAGHDASRRWSNSASISKPSATSPKP